MKDFLDLKRLWLDATTEDDINVVQRLCYFLAFFGIIIFLTLISISTFFLMFLFYEMFLPVIWRLSLFGWITTAITFAVGTRLYQGYKGRNLTITEEEYAPIYQQGVEEPVAYSRRTNKESE